MSNASGEATPAAAAAGKHPLNDLMLAMDVVDTLRHQELLVERELGAEDRDQRMKERLREIYASQGIDVSERILEQGVAALKEGRFVYDPPQRGWRTSIAELYVNRAVWGKPVLLGLALVLAIWMAYVLLISGPAHRAEAELPGRLQAGSEALEQQAVGPLARERVQALLAEGESALQRDDQDEAELVLARMEELREEIEREYDLRIVASPGERSGVWRIPDANSSARNFYIIVEAVGPYGSIYEVPVVNEEDGKTYKVRKWGLRVEQDLFEQIAADKADDGIIQGNRFGVKKRGYLTPEYSMPTTGGTITSW